MRKNPPKKILPPPKKKERKKNPINSQACVITWYLISFIFTVLITGYDTKMSCCYGFRNSVDTHSCI